MRTKLFGGVLALALVLPATAFASKVNLEGKVQGGGSIAMASKHSAKTGKYKVIDLQFSAVPIHCTSGDYTVAANTKGFVFKVAKDGTFGANLVPVNQDPPKNHLKISGKLTHHGTKASGTLSLKGDDVTTEGNGSQDGCNTGIKDWTAKKSVL
jgi:hypothetical protein